MSSLSRHNSLNSATERSLLTQQNEWQRPQLPVRLSVSNPPPSLADFPSHSHTLSHAALNAVQPPPQAQAQRRKKKAKAGSAQAKAQQLPPLDWQLAERRIDELHKVAAGARALHTLTLAQTPTHAHTRAGMGISLSPRPALVGPEGAGFSPRERARDTATERETHTETASLTGTEAEFLVRQIQSAGADDSLSQLSLSLLSNHDELRALSQGVGLDVDSDANTVAHAGVEKRDSNRDRDEQGRESGAPTAASVVAEALKGKIASLEKQLVSLSATVQRKEQELEKKDQRVRSLVKENEKLRSEKETELKRAQAEVSSASVSPFARYVLFI